MKTISPEELGRSVHAGNDPVIVDVRTPGEFRSMHIASATNFPMDAIGKEDFSEVASKDQTVHVICQAGGRSQRAVEQLSAMGYSDVVNVEGGMNAWSAGGHAVVEGKGTMSIERQVRIGAGSIVVLGVALSLALHPAFIIIPAFVGAGLVVAGITDWCGMGLVLARMPWNR